MVEANLARDLIASGRGVYAVDVDEVRDIPHDFFTDAQRSATASEPPSSIAGTWVRCML
ncbi:MAG: hypothetical protein HY319_11410 [Armatimonadetes bacterium]|nr:hypothetical protein [Armatimonadota bacterium]